MTVETKLMAHLEYIVMPLGVRLNARQVTKLCEQATRAQRVAAVDRARIKIPFLLPEEETEARMWIEQIGPEDLYLAPEDRHRD